METILLQRHILRTLIDVSTHIGTHPPSAPHLFSKNHYYKESITVYKSLDKYLH